VVEVLVDGDLDREVERVATARCGPLRSGSGLDAATATAAVLLLLHRDDAVADLDDVDHLRRVELPLHRRQLAAAARTRLVGGIELEDLLDHRQLRLLGVAELLARLLRLLLPAAERLELCGDRLRLPRELLDQRELLLQLLVVALERPELRGLCREHAKELLDLHLLRERDAAELLDVRLAP